mgnify:CR=1 FL=1
MKSADEIEKMTGRRPTVADLRFIKPLDREGLDKLLTTHAVVVTAEENTLAGGVGEAISSYINEKGYGVKIASAGVPDHFISHAARPNSGRVRTLRRKHPAALRLAMKQKLIRLDKFITDRSWPPPARRRRTISKRDA